MKTKMNISTRTSKSLFSIFLFAAFLLNGAFSFAQKADFTGNWAFNESKSQMGEGRFRAPASKLVVAQNETTLTIERTSKGMDGEENVLKEKYTLDGKECENTGFMNMVKKSKVTWSADNKALTISSTSIFERDGNSMEIKTIEVLTVSEDGKTLNIASTSISQRGERKQALVYEKSK